MASADVISLDWERVAKKLNSTVFFSAFLAAAVIPLCHWIIHNFIITPLGRKWLNIIPEKKSDEDQESKLRRLSKFQESAWKSFAYICLTIGSLIPLSKEIYWWKTSELWTECSMVPCEYEEPDAAKFAYALDMAYYLYAIPYCIFFETKRQDFWATMAHHIATVVLIGYSYSLGFVKVGIVVMFLHDICDPLLELAKVFKYTNRQSFADAFFVIFTLIWILMRDVYFPGWIINSVMTEAYASVTQGRVPDFPHYELFAGLLVFLWILHMYWTYIILRVAVKAVISGGVDDDREDDD